ncbi:MAG: hypothetical protein ACRC6V_06715 [Bacteroidales bacterium]
MELNIAAINEEMAKAYPSIPALTRSNLDDRWSEIILDDTISLPFDSEEILPFLEGGVDAQVEMIYQKYADNLIDLVENREDYFLGLDDELIEQYIEEIVVQLRELGHAYTPS